MNSIMERWVQTCRHELLDRTLMWNQRHLLHALREFEHFYNEHRPHRSTNQTTPGGSYRATPRALPTAATTPGFYRLRYDRVDKTGRITLRHAGRLHHLAIAAKHRSKRVLALVDQTNVTIVHLDTGEILATNQIDPTRNYWRNTLRAPGRWPRAHKQ